MGFPHTEIAAADLHQFFDDKVASVRAATAGAAPPTFTPAPAGCELRVFSPVSESEVIELIRALSDKQCASDPLPTRLHKSNVAELAPFMCRLINASISFGVVPASFWSAYITPLLEKADLDPVDPKSFRPISNLSVFSKLLERIVAKTTG